MGQYVLVIKLKNWRPLRVTKTSLFAGGGNDYALSADAVPLTVPVNRRVVADLTGVSLEPGCNHMGLVRATTSPRYTITCKDVCGQAYH